MPAELTFRIAGTDEERRAAQHVRYQVYCEEAGILLPHADRVRRLLIEPGDDRGVLLLAYSDAEVIGSVRLLFGRDGALTRDHRETLRVDEFERIVGAERLVVVERLGLVAAFRGQRRVSNGFILELVRVACVRRVDVLLADSEPHLLPMYRQLGMLPIGPPFDLVTAVVVPLVILLRDQQHLERLASPLARTVAGHFSTAPEPELLALLPRAGSEVILDADDSRRIGLFDGLTELQIAIVTREAEVLTFDAGTRIVNEDRQNTTLYVVLDGVVQVSTSERELAFLGAGEVFGEFAFLLCRPRSATVRAKTRTTLAALSTGALDRLIASHPTIGVEIFRNLARAIARKLDPHDDG